MTKRQKKNPEVTPLIPSTELPPVPVDAPCVEPILTNPEPAHIPVLRQLTIALLLLGVVFGTTYVGTVVALMDKSEPVSDVTVSATIAESTVDTDPENPFTGMTVKAKSAFVWDVREGKALFNKNADEALPLASITKLMTALVAYELLDDSKKVDITIEAVKTDGDSGLTDGEVFSLKDLTDMVLMASSNDGATALAINAGASVGLSLDPNAVFVKAMNLRAQELGLTNTRFVNATGLDISSTEAGAYSSARDVALLLEYIITTYPTVTSLTKESRARVYNERGEYHDVENTNAIIDSIDGLIASKTGYTDLAGGNLVIAFNVGLNRPIVVAVLGSTFNERFTDVEKLATAARAYVTENAE